MPTSGQWKAFLQPLTSGQTAIVIDDLFAAGITLRAAGTGPCMAADYLTLQASPARITAVAAAFTPAFFSALEAAAAAAGSTFSRASSTSEAELISQVAWAWTAAWSASDSPPSYTANSQAPTGMPAPAWVWCRRAFNFDSPFSSVAAARAAIPT